MSLIGWGFDGRKKGLILQGVPDRHPRAKSRCVSNETRKLCTRYCLEQCFSYLHITRDDRFNFDNESIDGQER